MVFVDGGQVVEEAPPERFFAAAKSSVPGVLVEDPQS